MKATVNFEFGSEEIEGFVKRALTDGILDAIGQMEPQHVQMMLSGIQTGIGMVLGQVNEIRIRRGHAPRGFGGPGMPQGPYAASAPYPSGAAAPAPGPGPYVYVPGQPNNVRPIRSQAEVAECFPIEPTRSNEEGWGCCRCASFNSSMRPVCRSCGHARCGATVTPAPAQPAPPQVPPVGQPTEEPLP